MPSSQGPTVSQGLSWGPGFRVCPAPYLILKRTGELQGGRLRGSWISSGACRPLCLVTVANVERLGHCQAGTSRSLLEGASPPFPLPGSKHLGKRVAVVRRVSHFRHPCSVKELSRSADEKWDPSWRSQEVRACDPGEGRPSGRSVSLQWKRVPASEAM